MGIKNDGNKICKKRINEWKERGRKNGNDCNLKLKIKYKNKDEKFELKKKIFYEEKI